MSDIVDRFVEHMKGKGFPDVTRDNIPYLLYNIPKQKTLDTFNIMKKIAEQEGITLENTSGSAFWHTE